MIRTAARLRTRLGVHGQSPGAHGAYRGDLPDATIEPAPAPPPEAVFDRLTGPYVRRSPAALPGRAGTDGEA